ncbi:uncharacterized protein [Glycine max]|uniref:uncharacterized protein isoform X2 n=1 Tax=Glycine max TaxID=3847 RepID=UPI001B35652C|nr:uncharacterized protein LOC113001154 isoform X2 [Glycine max]
MVLTYEFVFPLIYKESILVGKATLPLMSWLFVTLACVSLLFGQVGKVPHMILRYLWRLYVSLHCIFHILLKDRTRKLGIISRNLELGLESGEELKFLIIIIPVFEVQLNVHLVYVKQDGRYWVICHLFALKTQNQIIVACMAIHNFIQRNDKSDGEFDSLDEDNEDIDSDEDESEVGPSITTWEELDAQSTLQMERFRESLKNMFPTRI